MEERGVPFRGIVTLVLLGLVVLAALILPGNLFESLDAQEVMIIQHPLNGTLTVHTEPGVKWQGFGRITKYERRNQLWFGGPGEDGKPQGTPIKVRFNDGGHALLLGSMAWEVPLDHERLKQLHALYKNQDSLEQQLVRTIVEKAVYMTGPLMSSKESYAERRNELIRFIEDQTENGVYQTKTEQAKEPDPMTGAMRTVSFVRLVEEKPGIYARQEISPMTSLGIKVLNLSLNSVDYDDAVEKQIQTQQQAIMQVQTAVANAKRAEQDAITTAKQGEAVAAKAKWEQEALKAKAVTEAEQNLAVAELDRRTAEQRKQEKILIGQGDAEARRLAMAADNALDTRLRAVIEINKNYAEALSKMQVPIVPGVVFGDGGSKATGGADQLIEMLKAKTALDVANAAKAN